MSDLDVVQNIIVIEIELEEEDNGSLVDQLAPGEEHELTENMNTEETLTEQEDNEKKQEVKREPKWKVTIKQQKADEPEEPERVESDGSGRSHARQQYIYRQQQRYTDASPNTREKAEEKRDGDDKPKGKADNETGEGGSGKGASSQKTSSEGSIGDGPSEEKKAKLEEPSIVEDDDSNSNNSSECAIVFD